MTDDRFAVNMPVPGAPSRSPAAPLAVRDSAAARERIQEAQMKEWGGHGGFEHEAAGGRAAGPQRVPAGRPPGALQRAYSQGQMTSLLLRRT